MPKDKVVLLDGEAGMEGKKGTAGSNIRKLLKLLFGSYGIILSALSMMALAVLNGDAFADFTGGLIINIDDMLYSFGEAYAYPIAILISGMMFLGPLQYYVLGNHVDMIIILIIVFLFTGFIIGRMFRNVGWSFIAGFVVMLSFCSLVLVALNLIDYIAQSMLSSPVSISSILYSVIEGIFDMDMTSLTIYTTLENGALLGFCGAL